LFWKENAKGKKSYLRLETEDAALGDRRCLQRWWWLLPTASSGFPSVITCLCLSSFSVFVFCVLCISGFNCCRVLWVVLFLGWLLLGAVGCSVFGSSLCIISLVFLLFLLWFCLPFLWFSAPFIETQPLASNLQDCYLPRQDRGRETWSTISFVADYQLPCWIGSSPAESEAPLLKRDGRRTTVSNGAVSAENRNFQFDPCLWKFDNLIPTIF
jgi:hypothetical protein